jgi:hypothetical protein
LHLVCGLRKGPDSTGKKLADAQAKVVFNFGPGGLLKEKHPAAAAAAG